jgi:chromosome segregation ATPase
MKFMERQIYEKDQSIQYFQSHCLELSNKVVNYEEAVMEANAYVEEFKPAYSQVKSEIVELKRKHNKAELAYSQVKHGIEQLKRRHNEALPEACHPPSKLKAKKSQN